jgi:hypothetical protein
MGDFADGISKSIARGEPTGTAMRRTPLEPPRFTQTDSNIGEIVTSAIAGNDTPDWATIFAYWNLSPDEWSVDEGSLRVNAWEGPSAGGDTVIYRQYKAAIRRRTNADADVQELIKLVQRWKPRRRQLEADTGSCFVVVATDWQIGGEGGTERTVNRLLSTLDDIERRAKQAVKDGATHLLVPALGDLVEGVFGMYPAQPFTVDLDLSGQVRVARRVLLAWLKRLVPLFSHVTVVGIAGNHGRRGQKVETNYDDNADIDVVEGLAEVCAESDWGQHIEFVIPRETLVSLVPICGTNILLAHGDQVRGSSDKLRAWWKEVSFTRFGDSDLGDILIVGHRHHLRIEEVASHRWLMQAPAMDNGSRWYAEIGGGTSNSGVLTFSTSGASWWGLHICVSGPEGDDT